MYANGAAPSWASYRHRCRLEDLHLLDVQLVLRQAIRWHPQQQILRIDGFGELHLSSATLSKGEFGHLLALSGVSSGIRANIALTTGCADGDNHAVRHPGGWSRCM